MGEHAQVCPGACPEGRWVRVYRGFQSGVVGDTFSRWLSPWGDPHWNTSPGLWLPYNRLPGGGRMTYLITEFRRGNCDSVTQSFPGKDPSVLLLRAINFREAGLCREGAVCSRVSKFGTGGEIGKSAWLTYVKPHSPAQLLLLISC